MSPREIAKSMASGIGGAMKRAHPVAVLDLKDRNTGEFSYGKTVPIGIMVAIIYFHAVHNPLGIGHAILLSCTAIGPWALVKFLERTSVTISRSSTQAAPSGVVTEKTTQKIGDPSVAGAVEPGD